MTPSDARTRIRHALALAAGECQPKTAPLAPRFVDRAVELLADPEPERVDPVVRAARSAAVFMADLRDLLTDDAYAAVLPDLQRVLAAIEVEVPEQPSREPVRVFAGGPLPWER